MQKILISLPDQSAIRLRLTISTRQRRRVITHLIEKEIEKREKKLYECALAIEKDEALNQEMMLWEIKA